MEFSRFCGFFGSAVHSLLTGVLLSFNVYAVQLKAVFGFNQTQVELVASCFMIGQTFAVLGTVLHKRLGCKLVYVISWALLTSYALLVWMSTFYVEFFRNWIMFMCLFHLTGAAGSIISQQCCWAVALQNCSKRHSGKLLGLLTGLVGLGKLYYSVIMKVLDNRLRTFFLVFPLPVTITLVICFFFLVPPQEPIEDTEILKESKGEDKGKSVHMCSNEPEENETLVKTSPISRKEMLTSGYFHLTLWSGVMLHACALSFMNNITHIGHSINIQQPLDIVEVLSVSVMIFRLSFGILFDKLPSKRAGIVLIFICQVTFGAAMFIGLFCLNDVTIYVMTVLASAATGAVFSLTLTALFTSYGKDHYLLVVGIYFLVVGLLSVFYHVVIGVIYDSSNITNYDRCSSCFFWAYVMMLSVDGVVMLQQVINFLRFA